MSTLWLTFERTIKEGLTNTTDILFYINLAFAFLEIAEFTALCVLLRKTICMNFACMTAIFATVFGFATFLTQLVMYTFEVKGNMYAVYAATGVMSASFIVAAVYVILLGVRMQRKSYIVAGVLSFIPPIGAFCLARLAVKLRFDNRAEELVYGGYAYTYAALGAFAAQNPPVFADGSGHEKYEDLTKSQVKKLLAELKRNTKTAEGKFEYGRMLVHYRPKKYQKGFKYFAAAADGGYVPAIFNLGYCYEIGAGVKKNVKRAAEFYERALRGGDDDAELRLAVTKIASGKLKDGYDVFVKRAEKGDPNAKFDVGVCCELGICLEKDVKGAVSYYAQSLPLVAAEKRLFALAVEHLDTRDEKNKEIFDSIMAIEGDGDFMEMLKGLALIREKKGSDAADIFLSIAKRRAESEGMCRTLVGALYIDLGDLPADKANGAAFIKSAIGMTPVATQLYYTIPARIVEGKPNTFKKRST